MAFDVLRSSECATEYDDIFGTINGTIEIRMYLIK